MGNRKISNEGNLGMHRTAPTAAMEMDSDLQPLWIHLQTKVLLAITRMQLLKVNHPIQE
jgi:hypothetical protein